MAISSNLLSVSSNFKTNDPKESLQIFNKQSQIKLSSLAINYGKCSVTNGSSLVSTSSELLYKYPACSSKGDIHNEHEKRLNLFKCLLSKVGVQEPPEALAMIVDAVQRLGLDHYFEKEIEKILEIQFDTFLGPSDQDLHEVALRFRLLRQQGHRVSADVFNNFINNEGKFDKNVGEDIKGLMSLYEASQLSIHGEDVLEEANHFSLNSLYKWTTRLDNRQARALKIALEHPYRKSLAASMSENFVIDFNGGAAGWMNVLQELSKLDANIVRAVHQGEIIQVTKWWKDVGLANKLKFARDQPLKWYIWSTVCFKDPMLSSQRVNLTKAISFIYIIDDIFDVYGLTLDELTLFTRALNRWDITDLEGLPHNLKICFKALDDVTNEISYDIYNEYGRDPTSSLRKTWGMLCNAFLVEAKWFASGQIPSSEDYLKNGIISSGVHVVLVHALFLLGHNNDVTFNSIQDDNNLPAIISSVATILRLWDDLGNSQDEDQDGHDGSYAECYMKENTGTSIEEAKSRVTHMIGEAWKQLNKECLFPNQFSTKFIKTSLNFGRMIPLMYTYDDEHRLPNLDKYINSNLLKALK